MKEGLNLKYLCIFFRYLLSEKQKKFIIFLLIVFIFSLFPYFLVAINLNYHDDKQLRSFYGDGSILTLCIGILLSYYNVFFSFGKKDVKANDNEGKNEEDGVLIAVISFLIYAAVVIQFYFAQKADRDWVMILQILFESILLIAITLIITSYLHFKEDVSFADIQKFLDDRKKAKLFKDSENSTLTDDNIQL